MCIGAFGVLNRYRVCVKLTRNQTQQTSCSKPRPVITITGDSSVIQTFTGGGDGHYLTTAGGGSDPTRIGPEFGPVPVLVLCIVVFLTIFMTFVPA